MEIVFVLFLVAYACFWGFFLFVLAVASLGITAMGLAYVYACCWLISQAGTWDSSARRTSTSPAADAKTTPMRVAA